MKEILDIHDYFWLGYIFNILQQIKQQHKLFLASYPPFGLATITVLNIAAFLMLLGIYNSATLVSANNQLA